MNVPKHLVFVIIAQKCVKENETTEMSTGSSIVRGMNMSGMISDEDLGLCGKQECKMGSLLGSWIYGERRR